MTRVTRLRAPHADCGDILVAESFARLGAGLANVLARMADRDMHAGMAQHEVVRRVTNLRAIQHEANVAGVGVAAALFQAVVDRVLKCIVGFFAGMDACVHNRSLMFVDMGCHRIFVVGFCFLFGPKFRSNDECSVHDASRESADGATSPSLSAVRRVAIKG